MNVNVLIDNVVRSALSYQASVMEDESNANYSAQLELREEILIEAVQNLAAYTQAGDPQVVGE